MTETHNTFVEIPREYGTQLAKVVKELALYAKLASGQTKTKLNVCVVLMALSMMSWVAHAPNVLQTQSQMKVKPVVKL